MVRRIEGSSLGLKFFFWNFLGRIILASIIVCIVSAFPGYLFDLPIKLVLRFFYYYYHM